jgi:hypothetical protein
MRARQFPYHDFVAAAAQTAVVRRLQLHFRAHATQQRDSSFVLLQQHRGVDVIICPPDVLLLLLLLGSLDPPVHLLLLLA